MNVNIKKILGFLVVISVVLFYALFRLCHNNRDYFDTIEKNMADNVSIVLTPDVNKKVLSDIILNNGYAENREDADFIAGVLAERAGDLKFKEKLFNEKYSTLNDLQKRAYGKVRASLADSCGVLTTILQSSFDKLGQNEEQFKFVSPGAGNGTIKVRVVRKDGFWKKLPVEGVPVRLQTHSLDSSNQHIAVTQGFLTTDNDGWAVFTGLDTTLSYSVLPVKKGFEYGGSQGTREGKWQTKNWYHKTIKTNVLVFDNFVENEHLVPLFDNATIKQIRNDRTILVRTPDAWTTMAVGSVVVLVMAWLVLCLIIVGRKKHFDAGITIFCALLTGLSTIIMFSVQDPLIDEVYGLITAEGVFIGLVLAWFLQTIDFVKFYQNRCRLPFDAFFKGERTKGLTWLVLALVLTALLWTPFGQSVGGMKVNIKMPSLPPFQPSEIAKFLIIVFMAAYFTRNADKIIQYSEKGVDMGGKFKLLWLPVLGLIVLMGFYFFLEDMGPGLVLGITFIILYSMVKSKVDVTVKDKLTWEDIRKALKCDFAIMLYNVGGFLFLTWIGLCITEGMSLIFAMIWFLVYFVVCIISKNIKAETSFMANMVIFIFLFGGQMFGLVFGKNTSVAERFEQRVEMSRNPWGNLDEQHGGLNAKPVSNTQIANGLWTIASGGPSGQGLAKGNPNTLPAYHTDMILSTIGEQMGLVGLLFVGACFLCMLRKMSVVGHKHKTHHPFALYLCWGISIVMAVQFFVIALGSIGMIPLTGITVPFLSYGRVSMIFNIVAFSIVLSLAQNLGEKKAVNAAEERLLQREREDIQRNGHTLSLATWMFVFLAVVLLMGWTKYSIFSRKSTLVKPAYAINKQGDPVVEYNPRIAILLQNMYAGRIYDRKGVLLATSDRDDVTNEMKKKYVKMGLNNIDNMLKRQQRRYYPLDRYAFFMVGDINQGLMFSYNENNPMGYMAEAQHIDYLRGFDNTKRYKDGNPVKVRLATTKKKIDTYLEPVEDTTGYIQLRDYKELAGFLKNGTNGSKVKKHNEKVKKEKYDLHLTVDAALQVDLQNKIAEYVEFDESQPAKNLRNNNLLRISAVVLDAENGDLLAAVNYPLPDYERLRAESGNKYYSDNLKDSDWRAYTDRDLATTYQTAPGSTAKVMSAMAGFRKLGETASEKTYLVTSTNQIEIGIEPTGTVTMQNAIVKSSNCYFVNLVNDKDLYGDLKTIYTETGVNIGGITPYYYTKRNDTLWRKDEFDNRIEDNRTEALRKYQLFKDGNLTDPKDHRVKPMNQTNMSIPDWKWAWGQGYTSPDKVSFDIMASPLNMARVASAVVNKGRMPTTQYVMGSNEYEKKLRIKDDVKLLKEGEAAILKTYMKKEAANQETRNSTILPASIGGKTGTPERDRRKYNARHKNVNDDRNDGWYMFFVECGDGQHPLAVAVRLERLPKGHGSGAAVRLSKSVILPALHKAGYRF